MHRQLLKIIFISFILTFFSGVCYASEGINIFVSPPVFELDLQKGQTYQDMIYLLNKSDLSMPIEARVINFEAIDEEGRMDFPIETSENPRDWFEIENPYFILEPRQSEKVKFNINIPQELSDGGYYATILFEPKLPSYYFEERTVRTVPQIGVLFLLSVGLEGKERPSELLAVVEFNIPEEFHLQRLENTLASISGLFSEALAVDKKPFSIVSTSELPFTLRIQNNDLFHIKPEGKLIITSWTGRVVGETTVAETTILPKKIRRFPVEFRPELPRGISKYLPASVSDFLSKNLFWGKYQAHLIMDFEDGQIDNYISFWIFPWKTFLVIVFILAILIIIRKRLRAAIKIILTRKKFSTD